MDMVQFVDKENTLKAQLPSSRQQLLYVPRIVHIRANITGLDDPLIHFALLKSNPVPNFQRLFAQGCSVERAWIAPFGMVRIDQIFFLYAWSSILRASDRVARLSGLSLGIATPGDDNKRWLTTFPIPRHGRWVAWNVEIAMNGNTNDLRDLEIVLSEQNLWQLEIR